MGAVHQQPARRLFRQGPREDGLPLRKSALPDRELQAALGLPARRTRVQRQHAGGRVLAEKRALRPAQQVHALDVEQVERRHARAAQVDVVEVDARAALEAVVRWIPADAAHRDGRLPRIAEGDAGTRQPLLQVFEPPALLRLEGLAIDRSQRDRNLLGGFRTAPGIHGDGGERFAMVQRLRLCMGHHGEPGGESADGQGTGEEIAWAEGHARTLVDARTRHLRTRRNRRRHARGHGVDCHRKLARPRN